MGEEQTHIRQSRLNPPDCATTISRLIKHGMNDPVIGLLLISIHNPSCMQESIVETVKQINVVHWRIQWGGCGGCKPPPLNFQKKIVVIRVAVVIDLPAWPL